MRVDSISRSIILFSIVIVKCTYIFDYCFNIRIIKNNYWRFVIKFYMSTFNGRRGMVDDVFVGGDRVR